MKRIFAAILSLIISLAFITGCAGPKMTWDDCIKDGEKLAANGWTTYEVDIDGMAKEYKDACKKELGKEYEISIVNGLFYTNANYDMCAFIEFGSAEEANYAYELCSSRENNEVKFYISGAIAIEANSDEAMRILGYTFK